MRRIFLLFLLLGTAIATTLGQGRRAQKPFSVVEATIPKPLRHAGAIITAKTGMTELANFIAGAPTPMPGAYNAVGGFGMNPYDPRRDPREGAFDGRPALAASGSSSGIGTAANFWAA